MENLDKLKSIIQSSIDVKKSIHENEEMISTILSAGQAITHAFQNQGKVLLCGKWWKCGRRPTYSR